MWTLQIWFRTALQWKSSLSFTGLYCFSSSLWQSKMQTVNWLRTIVFRVRKQWDYCCHILICMVKTIVCSLQFTLTTLSLCMHMWLINRAPSNFAKKCLLKLIKLFSGHYTYVVTQYQNYPKWWHTASSTGLKYRSLFHRSEYRSPWYR